MTGLGLVIFWVFWMVWTMAQPHSSIPYGLGVPRRPQEPRRAWYWEFLGLEPGASHTEISKAYRRLAKTCHRDGGGSDVLMRKLNEARTLALGELHSMQR
jgi:hypothetical protein